MPWLWIVGCLIAGAEPASSIVPADAAVEVLTDKLDFGEGPAAAVDGTILFSDIPTGDKPGRILRFDPKTGSITPFVSDSGKSNGLFVDGQGRLVACQGADFGGRRMVRYAAGDATTDSPEVLASSYQGKRFNAPNDCCIDPKGRIWFTDPKYLGDEPRELSWRGVYRIDPDSSLWLAISQPAIDKPNGIHASPDGRTLYVADTNNEPVTQPDGTSRPGNMQLVAFPIHDDGNVGPKRVLADYAPQAGVDGMTVDQAGNLFAALRSDQRQGVAVYSPAGAEIGFIPTPAKPTNCIFGRGEEQGVLYITMDNGLGRVRLNTKGWHLPTESAAGK